MKCYAVYSYDTTPYSDEKDYYLKVFLDKAQAEAFVKEVNKEAWFDMSDWETQPDRQYDIDELDFEG